MRQWSKKVAVGRGVQSKTNSKCLIRKRTYCLDTLYYDSLFDTPKNTCDTLFPCRMPLCDHFVCAIHWRKEICNLPCQEHKHGMMRLAFPEGTNDNAASKS
mmetsp:Transcript_18085/g.32792  ORF Transcript_18085/g.32792 Transcript_18085/m.32792 type:complete len:101 (-) Transcript_18085:47-349(-)